MSVLQSVLCEKEREAYVVVEVGVRDRDKICCMRQIDKPIVSVLANVFVTGQIAMINPNVGRLVDGDGITVSSEDLGDLQVPHNHIFLTEDGETNASES